MGRQQFPLVLDAEFSVLFIINPIIAAQANMRKSGGGDVHQGLHQRLIVRMILQSTKGGRRFE